MKGITMFLFGLIVGIAFTVLAVVVLLPKQMFIEQESKFDFEETVRILGKSVADNKWSMPHQYDLQATMKKHGFDVKPVKIFSLCKPEHAYKILSSNNDRVISALMPCRVAVYKKNGKTYATMLNSGMFSKLMGKNIREVMGDASQENRLILEAITK